MNKTYAPHQQRVIQEASELKVRLDALTEFIRKENNELFKSLSVREQALLEAQRSTMDAYLEILNKRIELFGEPSYEEPVDKDTTIRTVKSFRQRLDDVLQDIKGLKTKLMDIHPSDRPHVAEDFPEAIAQMTISSRDLESSIMRLGMTLKATGNPTPYPNSYNPANSVVEPTADGLKL